MKLKDLDEKLSKLTGDDYTIELYKQRIDIILKLEKIYKAWDTAGDPVELNNMLSEILND